jgi:hypothetical protein
LTCSARSAPIRWPVATEPVNATMSVPRWVTSASPASAPPASRFTTPPGKPANASASRSVDSGVSGDGLTTAVLPAASAGASFQASRSSG